MSSVHAGRSPTGRTVRRLCSTPCSTAITRREFHARFRRWSTGQSTSPPGRRPSRRSIFLGRPCGELVVRWDDAALLEELEAVCQAPALGEPPVGGPPEEALVTEPADEGLVGLERVGHRPIVCVYMRHERDQP